MPAKTNNFGLFEQERERNNPMVATLSNRLVELRKKNLAVSLSGFEGSSHKLEHFKTLNGVDFIDDARSTNINAVWFALQSMKKPTVWITNIDSVDNLTDELQRTIGEKVQAIVIQGVYNTDVYEYFASLDKPVYVEMNLEDAVSQAYYACEKGYVVLYSPGVNSGTQQTYQEKGKKFQNAVGQL